MEEELEAPTLSPEPIVLNNKEQFRLPKIGLDIQPVPEHNEEPQAEISRWDGISAFVRRHELLYNNFRKVSDVFKTVSEFHDDPEAVANFNPLDPYYLNQAPKHFWPQLQRTATPGEFYRKLTQLRIEEEDDETINESSLTTMLAGGAIAGATNPLYWIPLAQGLRFPNVLKSGVLSAVKTVPKVAGLEALTELSLHSTQENRTLRESVNNVVSTAFLGGIFAGVGTTYAATKPYRYKSLIQSHLNGETVKFDLSPKGEVTGFNIYEGGGSAGAAKVRRLDLKGESLYGFSKGKEFPSLSKGFVSEVNSLFQESLGRKPNKYEKYLAGELGARTDAKTGAEMGIKIANAADDAKLGEIFPNRELTGQLGEIGIDNTVNELFQSIDAQYGSHYNAATPFIWFNGTFIRNPVILALTGKSAYAARFVNDMLEHNFDLTRSVVRGENLTIPVQTRLNKYKAMGFSAERFVNKSYSKYLEHYKKLGVTDVDAYKFGEYVKQFYFPIVTGKPHPDGFINKIANEFNDKYYKPITDELIELGVLPKDIKPKAAVGYVNRLYDTDFMRANRKYTVDFFNDQFTQTRTKVLNETQPNIEIKAQIDNLKDSLKQEALTDAGRAVLDKELKAAQGRLLRLKRTQYANMMNGKYADDMLVGKPGMTPEEIKKLTNLRKPIKKYKTKVRDEEAKLRVMKNEKNTKEALKKQEKAIKTAKEDLAKYRAELVARREAGELPPEFFRGEYLRKPSRGTIEFRPILNDADLRAAAKDMYDNIVGLSEGGFADAILSGESYSDAQNPFKARKNMINDEDLYNSGIMETDIRKNVGAFLNRAGRVIEMKKYLSTDSRFGEGNPAKYLADQIKRDFEILQGDADIKFAHMKEGLSGKELAKVVRQEKKAAYKLGKDEDLSQQVVRETYSRLMGTNSPRSGRLIRGARFLNNWAYSTQLGALVLLGAQDFVAPIFKVGPTAFLRHGPGAFLRMVGTGKLKDIKRFKESSADLAVGCELALAWYGHQFHVGKDFDLPLNMAERAMAKATSFNAAISGATPFSDFSNFIATTAIQSNTIRRLERFVAGEASKADLIGLRAVGLGDKKVAQQVLDLFGEHGEKISGAYLPNWNQWGSRAKDVDAKRLALQTKDAFQAAIIKELRSTIFAGSNIATLPLGLTPGGFNQSVLMYMGWMFTATSNYLVPLMQRADKNKVAGVAAMIAASYIVYPMREWAVGREPDLDEWNLTKKAIVNSGVGGIMLDVLNRLNSAGRIFPELMSDRYEQKGLDLMAGMPWTVGKTAANLFGMATNNDWNQKELEGAIRLIPGAWAIEFRSLVKKALAETGLKEKPGRGKD